jgi:hypothetical protein
MSLLKQTVIFAGFAKGKPFEALRSFVHFNFEILLHPDEKKVTFPGRWIKQSKGLRENLGRSLPCR